MSRIGLPGVFIDEIIVEWEKISRTVVCAFIISLAVMYNMYIVYNN